MNITNLKKNFTKKYKYLNPKKFINVDGQEIEMYKLERLYDAPLKQNIFKLTMKIDEEQIKKFQKLYEIEKINVELKKDNQFAIFTFNTPKSILNMYDILNDYLWYDKKNIKLYHTKIQYHYIYWKKKITNIELELEEKYSLKIDSVTSKYEKLLDENKKLKSQLQKELDKEDKINFIKSENKKLKDIEEKYEQEKLKNEKMNEINLDYENVKKQYEELLEKNYIVKTESEENKEKIKKIQSDKNELDYQIKLAVKLIMIEKMFIDEKPIYQKFLKETLNKFEGKERNLLVLLDNQIFNESNYFLKSVIEIIDIMAKIPYNKEKFNDIFKNNQIDIILERLKN